MKYFSTTKFVFIAIALALITFTYRGLIDPKDFLGIAMVVFYHYYNKNAQKPLEIQKEESLG